MLQRLRRGLFAGMIAALAAAPAAASGPNGTPVDLELVLAVDISYSMDTEEQALQRDGYIEAVLSREFLDALRQGPTGRIAVSYVEWAGETEQQMVVGWRIIDGPDTARAFADAISAAPLRRAYRTSISAALLFSADQFERNGFRGIRRVIDVSGDGVNNQGPLITQARDQVVGRGITVNGLPLLLKRSGASALDIPELDVYYEDCVIGGPGAFVIPVEHREEFARAIKTKLVMEIADLAPHPGVSPVMRTVGSQPRISCTIGEKIWRDHWSN